MSNIPHSPISIVSGSCIQSKPFGNGKKRYEGEQGPNIQEEGRRGCVKMERR